MSEYRKLTNIHPRKPILTRGRTFLELLRLVDVTFDRLLTCLRAALGGDKATDPCFIALMNAQLQHRLRHDAEALFEAAAAGEAAEIVLHEHQDASAVALAAIHREYADFRQLIVGVYGISALKRLGFPRRKPNKPQKLCWLLRQLSEKLSDPELDLSPDLCGDREGKSPVSGVCINTTVQARYLRRLARDTQDCLSDVARSRSRLKRTEIACQEAMASYDATFRCFTQTMEAFYRYADFDEEVLRLRALVRESGTSSRRR
jgi:hypothetical protein